MYTSNNHFNNGLFIWNLSFSYYNRYSIDYENTDPEKKFAIDAATGDVTTRNTVDREEQADYEVHILAIDEGN